MNERQIQQNNQSPSLTLMFLSFLRLGATSFGGPAIVAYIRRLVVEQKKWLDEESFRHGVAICQAIPGSTSIQNAAYVGLKLRGLSGAALNFVAFALPCFVLMMVLSALYVSFHTLPAVVSAFNGLNAIIVAIVANATVSFGLISLKTYRDIIITFVAAVAFYFGLNPILVILLAALLGIGLYKAENLPAAGSSLTKKPYSYLQLTLILVISALGFGILFFLDPQLFDLAATMSKINIFAFGGGFSAIPFMYHEFVDVRAWMDSSTLMNGIALGQVTPDPVVITSTFIGYIVRGPLGAIIATIAMFLPSFIILVVTVPYYDRLRGSAYFNKAITGIICSFVGLLLSVALRFAFEVPWEPIRIALAAAAFLALLWKVDIFYVVLIGTVIAILVL